MSLRPVMRFAFGCAVLLIAGFVASPARAADDTAKTSEEDLAKVQGLWERVIPPGTDLPYHRATKEVKGNKETVTYYDADGKVLRKHQVDVKLSRAGDVHVFTYSNMEVVEGDQKGAKSDGSYSYLYRVSKDEFREVIGLLPGDEEQEPTLTVWKRPKNAAGNAAATTDKPDDKAVALDAKALAGTWEPTMSQRGGNVEPEEQSKRHRLIFEGEHFTITRDGDTLLKGTYKIKPDAKPAQIDMTIEESPQNPDDQGKVVMGIIELTGDGLKWCTCGPRGTERPTEFASEDGSRNMYVVLKREKKDAKP